MDSGNLISFIEQIFVLIGIPAVLGAFYYLGRKIQKVDDITKETDEVGKELRDINRRLGTIEGHLFGLEAPGSPIQPTEKGWKWINESGLADVIHENREVLLDELEDELPDEHTEYDVQEVAGDILYEKKDDAMMKPVKEYAYKNGMNLESILRIGRLVLRDDFLQRPYGKSENEDN